MNEQIELQKIRDDLSGPEGIIYLMFCGRETYVSEIQKPILEAGIYKNKESIAQAFYRLLNEEINYLIYKRQLRRRGRPKVYTAKLEPIITTLSYVLNSGQHSKLLKSYMENLLKKISPLNDAFPKVFASFNGKGNGRIPYNTYRWYNILNTYFLSALLHTYPENEMKDMLKGLKKILKHIYKEGDLYLARILPLFFPETLKVMRKQTGIEKTVDRGLGKNDYFFLLLATAALVLEDVGYSSVTKILVGSFLQKFPLHIWIHT